jgi:hypothetical protein
VTPELQADWATAAADAGFDPALVVLYPLPSAGLFGAMHYPPGRWPHQYDNEFAYDDRHRQALYDLRDRHVLVVDGAIQPPKRVLLLRHEAEHVAQYEANPAGAEVALRLAVGLPGADWLYLAMPHERDADAAATRLREAVGIEATDDEALEADRMLYVAAWPAPDRDTLPLRLLAFTLFYPEDFDLACTANQFWPYVDPAVIVEEMIEGGTAARAQFRDLFEGFLEELTDHGITQQEWDAMGRAERNRVNDDLRARVVEAEAGAVTRLREILERLERSDVRDQ